MPPALSPRRIAALRRMRRADAVLRDFEPVADSLYDTPQDLVESLAFFRDGTSVLVRDLARGRHRSGASVLVLFSGLALATFPLTPMLLPVIDKWRGDVAGLRRGDYVPGAFTRRKLAAVRRVHRVGGVDGVKSALQRLRQATSGDPSQRPSTDTLLTAILVAQQHGPGGQRACLLDNLAGGGGGGRRWRLVYTADKASVVASRHRLKLSKEARRRPLVAQAASAMRRALPWSQGLYVDRYVRLCPCHRVRVCVCARAFLLANGCA